jgi:hypothetical protein
MGSDAISLPRIHRSQPHLILHRADVHACDCVTTLRDDVTTRMTLDARGKVMTLPLLMYWSPREVSSRIDGVRTARSVVRAPR